MIDNTRRIVVVACVSLAASAGTRPARGDVPAVDLAGIYACEGSGRGSSPYRGLVSVQHDEQRYRIRWVFPSGAQVVGLGIRLDDMLAVSYFGSMPGVAVYTVERGGRLVGERTEIHSRGQLFRESWTRVADVPPARRHRRGIANPSGPGHVSAREAAAVEPQS